MATSVVYGIGGYDESKPNNNIIETVEVPDPPADPLSTLLDALSTATSLAQVRAAADAAQAAIDAANV